jgi:hypothetical protein
MVTRYILQKYFFCKTYHKLFLLKKRQQFIIRHSIKMNGHLAKTK